MLIGLNRVATCPLKHRPDFQIMKTGCHVMDGPAFGKVRYHRCNIGLHHPPLLDESEQKTFKPWEDRIGWLVHLDLPCRRNGIVSHFFLS